MLLASEGDQFPTILGQHTLGNKYMEIEIGDVIASRKLKVISGLDEGSLVEVLLGRPRPTPNARDFLVPYLIKSTKSEKRQCAVGIERIPSPTTCPKNT